MSSISTASNTTTATIHPTSLYGFTDAEKGVLPLGGLVLAPACAALVFWYVRRRAALLKNRSSDHISRSAPFYAVMGGALLGQFLCHIILPAVQRSPLGASTMTLFVLLGYAVMLATDKCGRVCVDGHYMHASADIALDEDVVRDDDSGEQRAYVQFGDLGSEDAALGIARMADHAWNRRNRSRVVLTTTLALLFVVCLEGMELVYAQPFSSADRRAWRVVLFLLNKTLQSAVVFGGLVHAKLHETERRSVRLCLWVTVSAVWAVAVTLSVVPALLDSSTSQAQVRAAMESWPLGAAYAIAGGILLWVAGYYTGQRPSKTDRQQTVVSIALFVGAAGASWGTSLLH